VVNDDPGSGPLAFTFDPARDLTVAEAGTNALASYAVASDGTLTLLVRTPSGQAATYGVAAAQSFLYTSNAGSASVSRYETDSDGALSLLGASATDPGTVDATATADGQFLYVQTGGNGIVDAFRVTAGGGSAPAGSVLVPGGVGGEGIVAI